MRKDEMRRREEKRREGGERGLMERRTRWNERRRISSVSMASQRRAEWFLVGTRGVVLHCHASRRVPSSWKYMSCRRSEAAIRRLFAGAKIKRQFSFSFSLYLALYLLAKKQERSHVGSSLRRKWTFSEWAERFEKKNPNEEEILFGRFQKVFSRDTSLYGGLLDKILILFPFFFVSFFFTFILNVMRHVKWIEISTISSIINYRSIDLHIYLFAS